MKIYPDQAVARVYAMASCDLPGEIGEVGPVHDPPCL